MSGAGEQPRICTKTGLRLVQAPPTTFRVAETAYGPLNPPGRTRLPKLMTGARHPAFSHLTDTELDQGSWNRWDVPGKTVYTSATAECAYAEVLQPFKQPLTSDSGRRRAEEVLAGMFDGHDPDGVANLLAKELTSGCMPVGSLSASWRDARTLYSIRFPAESWWVDVTHPDTFAALEQHLGSRLADLGLNRVDLHTLTTSEREVTVAIAEHLQAVTLDDDTQPAGVAYQSVLGTGLCYAYWIQNPARHLLAQDMRSLADWVEQPTEHSRAEIRTDDPALVNVARRFNLRVF